MRYSIQKLRAIKEKLLHSKRNEQILGKRTDFYSQFISSNDLCFDVGANLGNRIEPFLRLNAKVIAIEPQKNCCKFLRWKFKDKIVLIEKGLGENEEEKTFYISDVSTLSSFSEEWINSVLKSKRFGTHQWKKTKCIEIKTLDSLIKQYGVPKFIKIDVEGYELEVLKGLSYPVDVISFEYTVPEQTQKIVDCIKQIEKINNNTLFNYSIAENMELAFSEWVTSEKMIDYIHAEKFQSSNFGDIYSRTK
jgi:FkbM family methyltransferase